MNSETNMLLATITMAIIIFVVVVGIGLIIGEMV